MYQWPLFSLRTRSFQPNMTVLHVGQRNPLERFPDQSQSVMGKLKDSSTNLKAFSQKFCSLTGLANPSLFNYLRVQDFYLSNRPNFLSVYRHSNLLELLGEHDKSL